jgi:hypothetical protein
MRRTSSLLGRELVRRSVLAVDPHPANIPTVGTYPAAGGFAFSSIVVYQFWVLAARVGQGGLRDHDGKLEDHLFRARLNCPTPSLAWYGLFLSP